MTLIPKHVPNDQLYATKWLMSFENASRSFSSFDTNEVGSVGTKIFDFQDEDIRAIFHRLEDLRLNHGFYGTDSIFPSYEFRKPVWEIVIQEVSEYTGTAMTQEAAATLLQGCIKFLLALKIIVQEIERFEKQIAIVLDDKVSGFKEKSWGEYLKSAISVEIFVCCGVNGHKNQLLPLRFETLRALIPKIHSRLQVLIGSGAG